jgi:hypothetical protein
MTAQKGKQRRAAASRRLRLHPRSKEYGKKKDAVAGEADRSEKKAGYQAEAAGIVRIERAVEAKTEVAGDEEEGRARPARGTPSRPARRMKEKLPPIRAMPPAVSCKEGVTAQHSLKIVGPSKTSGERLKAKATARAAAPAGRLRVKRRRTGQAARFGLKATRRPSRTAPAGQLLPWRRSQAPAASASRGT